VQFVGAAPFQPGQRVRVDVAGLPMLGVFAGKGATAAGTIVGVNAREREVRVFLDAVFDGQKEIAVPPERVRPDG
jgi:ribosomal protein L21E